MRRSKHRIAPFTRVMRRSGAAAATAFVISSIMAAPAGAQGFGRRDAIGVTGVSGKAVNRLDADLALSDAQRPVLAAAHKAYAANFESIITSRLKELEQWHVEYWCERMPELRESFDLSNMDSQQRIQVLVQRALLQQGQSPADIDDESHMQAVEQLLEANEFVAKEEAALRKRLIDEVMPVLGDSQIERLPRALTRLTIMVWDEAVEWSRGCPVGRVDMFRVIDAAANGELAPFADAFRCVDAEGVPAEQRDVMAVVLAFERSYADALDRYHQHLMRLSFDGLRAYAAKDDEARLDVRRKKARNIDAVWTIRIKLIEDIFLFARDAIGEEAAAAWHERAYACLCPTAYAENAFDDLYRRIIELPLDEVQRAAVESLHSDFARQLNRKRRDWALAEVRQRYEVSLSDPSELSKGKIKAADARDELRRLTETASKALRSVLTHDQLQALDADGE